MSFLQYTGPCFGNAFLGDIQIDNDVNLFVPNITIFPFRALYDPTYFPIAVAVIVFASTNIVLALSAMITLGTYISKNANSKSLLLQQWNSPLDGENWRRLIMNPLVLLAWTVAVMIVFITVVSAGLSPWFTQAVYAQSIAETLIFVSLIECLVPNLPRKTRALTLLGVLVVYVVLQYFVGSIYNPFITGVLGTLALPSDIGHAVVAVMFALRVKHEPVIGPLSGVHAFRAVWHNINFYPAAAACTHLGVGAIWLTTALGVDLIVSAVYVIYLLRNWRLYVAGLSGGLPIVF